MKSISVLSVLFLAASAVPAQRLRFNLDSSTPEGALLQMAAQESDEGRKAAIYEDYLAKHPKHDGVSWACGQLAPLLIKAGQFDKAIKVAEAGLAADPLNAPLAYNGLQAAEGKKDNALIKEWSARTVDSARKALETKKPVEDDEVEEWNREVDYARQVIERADYALYAAALQATDPKVAVDLAEALEKRNPQSQYVPQAAVPHLRALLQLGQTAPALALAGRMAAAGKAGEDMLLLLADTALAAKEYQNAAGYSAKIIEKMSGPPPQGADAAAWEARKKALLGRAHWTSGFALANLEQWTEADQAMRTALPLVESNPDLLPAAYFYIGVANHRLGSGPKGDKTKLPEARKFMQMCAALKSPFQETAQKNLAAMGRGK